MLTTALSTRNAYLLCTLFHIPSYLNLICTFFSGSDLSRIMRPSLTPLMPTVADKYSSTSLSTGQLTRILTLKMMTIRMTTFCLRIYECLLPAFMFNVFNFAHFLHKLLMLIPSVCTMIDFKLYYYLF